MSDITKTYDETMLLAALAADSDEAFALLYERYWEKIYAVASLYLKDSSMAEDIVQETFLRLWKKRASLPDIHNFQGYLHVIARNLIISSFRKKMPHFDPCYSTGDAEKMQDYNLRPLLRLEQRETSELISKAVNQLPPRQKQTYLLSSENELSLKEVAHELNISYDTARQYKSEALQFIRSFLEHNSCFLCPLALMFQWM